MLSVWFMKNEMIYEVDRPTNKKNPENKELYDLTNFLFAHTSYAQPFSNNMNFGQFNTMKSFQHFSMCFIYTCHLFHIFFFISNTNIIMAKYMDHSSCGLNLDFYLIAVFKQKCFNFGNLFLNFNSIYNGLTHMIEKKKNICCS